MDSLNYTMKNTTQNGQLGHIMAQNDGHRLEKHISGRKKPLEASSKGPLRASNEENRAENGFPQLYHEILIIWVLFRLKTMVLKWKSIFLRKTTCGAPLEGPLVSYSGLK